jgi:NAD(P)-dependent dehydrogenase (short-subunit alcohol dehydrogenase family)
MTKNKNIIILGSEGALGCALIAELQRKKFSAIIAVDKNKKTQHKKVNYFCADFSDAKQVEILSEFLQKNLTGENLVISTVGKFGDDYESEKFTAKNLLDSLQINLLSIAKISLDLSKKCVASKKKMRLVIIGSTAGAVGSRDIGYGISKSGLNGLVISLSKVFAQKNVTVIGVNPGIFISKMSQGVAQERQKAVINQTHLKRAGTVAEIVSTTLYAALDAPDFLTGSLINVNGGQCS